jgi:FkbM family methyltransferase
MSDPGSTVAGNSIAFEQIVRALYQGILQREPDAGGKDTQLRALAAGDSLATLIQRMLTSDEFRSKQAMQHDEALMQNAKNVAVTDGGADWRTVKRRLEDQFGKRDPANADVVDAFIAFNLLLGRDPDETGWQSWSHGLQSGMNRYTLVSRMTESAEYVRLFAKPMPRRITLNQIDYFLPDGDAFREQLANQQAYEPHVAAFIDSVLPNDGCFVDIGANIGWHSLRIAKARPNTRVIAFEPEGENLRCLVAGVHANQTTNLAIFPLAVCDRLGVAAMDGNGPYGRIQAAQNLSDRLVPTIDADFVLASLRVHVIKIDVEGAESMVLTGLRHTIMRDRPTLIVEYHPNLATVHYGQSLGGALDELARKHKYSMHVIDQHGGLTPIESSAALGSNGLAYMRHWDVALLPT